VDEIETPGKVRVDKWLWAARFFKTRSLAADAVGAGHVEVNGERVKRAKTVQAGDRVKLRLGPYEHHVVVRDVAERRGPASVAATLYEETPESKAARAQRALEMKSLSSAFSYDAGKPTKKDRRDLDRFRGKR
jgi:ribosome-associated heat shock protein Hsp15